MGEHEERVERSGGRGGGGGRQGGAWGGRFLQLVYAFSYSFIIYSSQKVENSRKSRKLAGCPISLKPLSQPT